MGGVPPFGYRVADRKLVVEQEQAAQVRWIFARFLEIGSCTELAREAGARGIRTPKGNRLDKKYLYARRPQPKRQARCGGGPAHPDSDCGPSCA